MIAERLRGGITPRWHFKIGDWSLLVHGVRRIEGGGWSAWEVPEAEFAGWSAILYIPWPLRRNFHFVVPKP